MHIKMYKYFTYILLKTIRATLGYHSITQWRIFQISNFLLWEMLWSVWSKAEQRRMGNQQLTRDSRNHVEKQNDNGDMDLIQKLQPFIQSYEKDTIIAGMTHACLNARSTTLGHASDKPTDCPKIDALPDLNQGIGELLDCPGWVWKPPNALVHDVPEVLDGVQVRRTCWLVICVNALIL